MVAEFFFEKLPEPDTTTTLHILEKITIPDFTPISLMIDSKYERLWIGGHTDEEEDYFLYIVNRSSGAYEKTLKTYATPYCSIVDDRVVVSDIVADRGFMHIFNRKGILAAKGLWLPTVTPLSRSEGFCIPITAIDDHHFVCWAKNQTLHVVKYCSSTNTLEHVRDHTTQYDSTGQLSVQHGRVYYASGSDYINVCHLSTGIFKKIEQTSREWSITAVAAASNGVVVFNDDSDAARRKIIILGPDDTLKTLTVPSIIDPQAMIFDVYNMFYVATDDHEDGCVLVCCFE